MSRSGSLYGTENLLGEVAQPSPITGGDSAIVSNYPLVVVGRGQEADSKLALYLDFNSVKNPQPIRGSGGQTDPRLSNGCLNPHENVFAPPGADSGAVPNAQWSLGLSHNRFGIGKQSGWARQQNVNQLPASTEFAGVDKRLAPHAYRELHWHTANEWSLMLKGSVRLAAVDENRETLTEDISAGIYFNGTPGPTNIPEQIRTGPAGILPLNGSYTYHFSQQDPYVVPGGAVKIIDSTTFPIAKDFAAALVTIQPGAMRKMHWHLTSDEWRYFLQGSARITVYLAPDSSNTFEYTAGGVGYIAASNSQNTGTEDLIVLEVLKHPKFTDISVAQWLALTPKQVVKDTLGLTDETLGNLPKQKTYMKPGNRNMTALAANPNDTAAYPE